MVYPSLSDTKDACLSCGGCFGCFALCPLGGRFLFSLTFCFLALLPKLHPLLFRLFLTRLFGRDVPRPLSLPLGFLPLLPGLQPPLVQLVLPSLLGLGNTGLDFLHLFFAQCPLHCGQQFALFVAGVLAEGLLQLLDPPGEGLIVLRQGVEFSKLCPEFPIVLDRVGDQPLFVSAFRRRTGKRCCSSRLVCSSSSAFRSANSFSLVFTAPSEVSDSLANSSFALAGAACISVWKLIVSPLPATARAGGIDGKNHPAVVSGFPRSRHQDW
jgi:hypothetical protein